VLLEEYSLLVSQLLDIATSSHVPDRNVPIYRFVGVTDIFKSYP
jgi:hypothetical protein